MMEEYCCKISSQYILLFSVPVLLALPSPQHFACFLLICSQTPWNLVQILFSSIEWTWIKELFVCSFIYQNYMAFSELLSALWWLKYNLHTSKQQRCVTRVERWRRHWCFLLDLRCRFLREPMKEQLSYGAVYWVRASLSLSNFWQASDIQNIHQYNVYNFWHIFQTACYMWSEEKMHYEVSGGLLGIKY